MRTSTHGGAGRSCAPVEGMVASRAGRRIDIDDAIGTLAATQHGVVTRAQLRAGGIEGHAIDRRVKAGRLRNLHRGVYHFGPLHSALEREMAATLACGGEGLLSHRSAAALLTLLRGPIDDRVEVSSLSGRRAICVGVRVHRIRPIGADERTVEQGIPVTTAARTILDVASYGNARDVEQAMAQADRLRLARPEMVERLVARYPGRRGVALIRQVLGLAGALAWTRSEAEARCVTLVRTAQLPAPLINARVLEYEVDFLWPAERVIMEVDGYAFHSSRASFERDRWRDATLVGAGYRVVRVTWRQLADEPVALMVRLAQALAVGLPR